MSSRRIIQPPRTANYKGEPRRVGVELEFAAVSSRDAAQIVQGLFGGEITAIDAHRHQVNGTELGDFVTELDSQYVHNDATEDTEDATSIDDVINELREGLQKFIGDASAVVVPCEIVCPPVELPKLAVLERLLDKLRAAGAEGTSSNPLFAFGMQLNPEIADKDAGYLCSVLKSYLLLSDWLRKEIDVDLTRRIFAFAAPFPKDYALKVLAPGYAPDTAGLIDDYLTFNPTRNRELDLLPLFSWLDEPRVRQRVSDARVKSRPTYHYRLPNALFGDPSWTLSEEWNRWCVVERLAERHDLISEMAAAYTDNYRRLLPGDWGAETAKWIARL